MVSDEQDTADLESIAKQLDEQSFLQKHPHPFLIELLTRKDDTGSFMYSTEMLTNPAVGGIRVLTKHSPQCAIPVKHRGPAPFEAMITVGRAPNNDIVLRDNSVSKLHAYFEVPKEDALYVLLDNNSKNGTFLNGQRLRPQEKYALEDGFVISFGARFSFVFRTAVSLHVELVKRARKGPTSPRSA